MRCAVPALHSLIPANLPGFEPLLEVPVSGSARLAGRFLVRELGPMVLVALAVYFALRRIALDQYLVPSQSMAPALVGDPRYGDRVLVSKLAGHGLGGWQPERFDMVVLRNPEDERAFLVKRLVGLPGESLAIRGGDVWLAQASGRLERVQKHPIEDLDLLVPWIRVLRAKPDQSREQLAGRVRGLGVLQADSGGLRLLAGARDAERLAAGFDRANRRVRLTAVPPDGTVPGFVSTQSEIDTGFPLPAGARGGDAQELAQDPCMVARLVPEAGMTDLLMVWEHRGDVHLWSYHQDGTLRYLPMEGKGSRSGSNLGPKSWNGPPLEPGVVVEVRFGHLDGRRFLTINGEVVDLQDVTLPQSPYAYEYPRPRPARNGLHLGCAGRGGARLESLQIFRDLQYRSPDIPRHDRRRFVVPKDEYFLLGDNAAESRDSASIDAPTFRVEDLVGRPVMVLAPASRRRTLLR